MIGSSRHAGVALDLETFELEPGTTLIEASAGTGKTFTIQYLVLDLLLKGLELKEILVVTFTEAATQELRDRLQGFLTNVRTALTEGSVSEPLRSVLDRGISRLGAEAVEHIVHRAMLHIDAAPIYTIHGFCQRALQENAFAADVGFSPELCADTSGMISDLVRDFLRVCNLHLKRPLPKSVNFKALCKRAGKLTRLLRVKAPCQKAIKDVFSELEGCAARIVEQRMNLQDIAEELRSFQGRLNAQSYRAAFFEDIEDSLEQLLTDPFQVNDSVLGRLGAGKIERSFKKAHFGTRVAHPVFGACERFLEARSRIEGDFLRCFDAWFIGEFNRLKLEQARITYDDMILDLDRALQSHERLRAQLKGRYRAGLVDEFQDTDARQYRIFRTLFASGDEADDRRYFAMIGDPKQSIYSFRGADVHAYLQARQDAGHRYTLPTNFRSEPRVIEGVNQFFNGINLGEGGAESGEGAIPFQPVRAADPGGRARLVAGDGLFLPGLVTREVEPPVSGRVRAAAQDSLRQTVWDVAELLSHSQTGRVLIESESNGALQRRPIECGDIAVLVDTHREAEALQNLFREEGLLAVRGKSGDIFASEEAGHFLQFLLACLLPSERSLNLLLVSPLFGKTNAELLAMADVERQSLYELFNALGRSWKGGASVSAVWAKFLAEASVRARLLSRSDGERRMTNYIHLCELAQEIERAESLSSDRLTSQILERVKAGAYGGDTGSEAHLIRLESDDAAIKLLTMHASKGLEFPVVFLPTLWQKTIQGKDDPVVRLDALDPDCLESLEPDPALIASRMKSEALRIGYVAMTRAVHLCVYYRVSDLPQQHPRSNHKDGWFDQWIEEQAGSARVAHEAFAFPSLIAGVSPLEPPPPPPPEVIQPRSLGCEIPRAYQITSYSALARAQGEAHAGSREDPSVRGGEEEFQDEGSMPVVSAGENSGKLMLDSFPGGIRTGTFIHEVMECCNLAAPGSWRPQVKRLLHRHFSEGGPGVLEQRGEEVLTLLQQLADEPVPLRDGNHLNLKSIGADQQLHEMEFYFPVKGVDVIGLDGVIKSWARRNHVSYNASAIDPGGIDGFLTGSIDLFFQAGGRYYLLDWKTNSPRPGRPRSLSSYGSEGMHSLMSDGRYYLQALIYSVATTAYLKDRLGNGFDFQSRVGGFLYCFLRGVSAQTGWLHGQFSEVEILQASQALGQTSESKGRMIDA